MIRRQIDDDTWKRRVEPALAQGLEVKIEKGGKTVLLNMDHGFMYFKADADGSEWAELKPHHLAPLKAQYDLVDAPLAQHLQDDPSFKHKENKGKEFIVTEFADQPLSMVHHTQNKDGSNSHLTVENAHILAIKDLMNPAKRDVTSKSGQDKGTINERLLEDYDVADVDNMNFYEQPKRKGAKKKGDQDDFHLSMPLSQYLAFVVGALDKAGVRAEYGERMMTMADRMASDKKLKTTELFLRVGMDESAFVRSVLVIDDVLAAADKLNIPNEARDTFAKWWKVDDNEDPVPYLPEPTKDNTPAAQRPLLRSGTSMKDGTSFATVEKAYLNEFFLAFATAVNTFAPPPNH